MLTRAYSTFEIKSVDDTDRIIEGIASTPSLDRQGDVMEPMGAKYSLPLPFLWQHGKQQPAIGHVERVHVTPDGIAVRVRIEKDDQPGPLKDLLDLAWRAMQKGLARGLSIGWRPLAKPEPVSGTFGLRFKEWEWLELSAVTVPANAEATISLIKSIDAEHRAASGTGDQALARPSAGGSAPVVVVSKGTRPPMKTFQEQITDLTSTRQAKEARRNEIQRKVADEGRTKDDSERQEFSTLQDEIKAIDAELADLQQLEDENKSRAKAVNGASPGAAAASRSAATSIISVRDNLPPGMGYTRMVLCKAASFLEFRRGNFKSALDIAKERYPDDARIQMHLKAAVPAATTTDSTWAGALVDPTNLASEFVDFLRPQTILGKFGQNGVPELRRVPFNIRFIEQIAEGDAWWVGQGKPKPMTSFGFEATTLGFAKLATLTVLTQETVRFSSPSAEMLARQGLSAAIVKRSDIDFVDPAKAAESNVSPASITNGLTPLTSAGPSAENVRTDIQNLLKAFLAANMNVADLVLIMPNSLALALSLMRTDLGAKDFDGMTINGGTLEGIPVITSQYLANASGPGNIVIALSASDIFLADDGQVNIDVSTEASVEMNNAPTQNGAAGTGASLVSLWQNNMVGFLAERFINWQKRRDGAVVYMDDVNWGSVGSPS